VKNWKRFGKFRGMGKRAVRVIEGKRGDEGGTGELKSEGRSIVGRGRIFTVPKSGPCKGESQREEREGDQIGARMNTTVG